jgi:hypothetical protein
MKIQLFDDEDLKRFEDHMARALVRALRTVMKEGLIAGYSPPKPEVFAEAPAQAPDPTPEPVVAGRPPWAQPATYGARMGDPQSGHSYKNGNGNGTAAPPQPPTKEKRPGDSKMGEFCASTSKKPEGYITTSDAYELMDMPIEHAKSALRIWIAKGDVSGVIWCDSGMTPTKGLPGRLMVKAADVRVRDQRRKQTAKEMGLVAAKREKAAARTNA